MWINIDFNRFVEGKMLIFTFKMMFDEQKTTLTYFGCTRFITFEQK